MAGINHVTGEWWWIPGTRGLKRGCPMKDGKIDNKKKNKCFFFFFLIFALALVVNIKIKKNH